MDGEAEGDLKKLSEVNETKSDLDLHISNPQRQSETVKGRGFWDLCQ